MKLENRILALIAVGASVTASCQPCLEHNVGTALGSGADNDQIAEAMKVGRMVRQGAASKLDKFAASLDPAPVASSQAASCECNS